MPFTTIDAPHQAEVSSDVTHTQSDTALEDVTGASFTVTSGGTYSWMLFLLFNSSAVADLDIAYSVPAGAGRHGITSVASSTDALTAEVRIAGAGADASVLMWGHYQPTADGTIQLRFAQGTSEATNTVILDGTTLLVFRSA
jgi:hypothetical protein